MIQRRCPGRGSGRVEASAVHEWTIARRERRLRSPVPGHGDVVPGRVVELGRDAVAAYVVVGLSRPPRAAQIEGQPVHSGYSSSSVLRASASGVLSASGRWTSSTSVLEWSAGEAARTIARRVRAVATRPGLQVAGQSRRAKRLHPRVGAGSVVVAEQRERYRRVAVGQQLHHEAGTDEVLVGVEIRPGQDERPVGVVVVGAAPRRRCRSSRPAPSRRGGGRSLRRAGHRVVRWRAGGTAEHRPPSAAARGRRRPAARIPAPS